MPGPDGEDCSACYYGEPIPGDDDLRCRKEPFRPLNYTVDGDVGLVVHYVSRQGRTRAGEWCGSFREKVVPARHAPADVLRGPIGEGEAGG